MADTFWLRLKGLMFKKSLDHIDGLLFESKSLHTHFMRFNLDIIFLSKDFEVIKVIQAMKPWRMTSIYWKAKYAIELKSGVLTTPLSVGDRMDLLCIN